MTDHSLAQQEVDPDDVSVDRPSRRVLLCR